MKTFFAIYSHICSILDCPNDAYEKRVGRWYCNQHVKGGDEKLIKIITEK